MITADELSPTLLTTLCARADAMRSAATTPEGRAQLAAIAPHRRALNLFAQPSSRTYLSFEAAESVLGMDRMNVRDLSTSSFAKGESLEDALHTMFCYCDLFVMRHPDDRAIEIAAQVGGEYGVAVVNAGSGTREHPTQALLDAYTIVRSKGSLDGHTYLLAGDLARGRTVRSLARLLRHARDVQLVLAAPDALQLDQDVLDLLTDAGVPWRQTDTLDVEGADVVYLTRVQDEWDGHADGHPPTDPRFVFRAEHLAALGPQSIVMHPLPKRDEVTPDVCATRDERLVWWEQVQNGLWARAALIEHLLAQY